MKVNMALIPDTDEEPLNVPDNDDEEGQQPGKGRKFTMTAGLIIGLGLCIWGMTGVVNNMRLNNQGRADAVYEAENLEDFMDGTEDNEAIDVYAHTENGADADAVRSSPDDLKKEAEDAKNEAALVRQELKNAEDMLESSLLREEELQNQLDALQRTN